MDIFNVQKVGFIHLQIVESLILSDRMKVLLQIQKLAWRGTAHADLPVGYCMAFWNKHIVCSETCFCTWGKVVLLRWIPRNSYSCLWHFVAGKHFLLFFSSICCTWLLGYAIIGRSVNIHTFCPLIQRPCSTFCSVLIAVLEKQTKALQYFRL